VVGQQPAGPLAADVHDPARIVGQVADQLAQAPVGERAAELLRAAGGRRDQEFLVLSADPAGTATRPARVQRTHAQLVEPVDHLPHGVLVGGDQPGDRRHRIAAGRGEHHHRPAVADHALGHLRLAAAHDL
jgi:hypothetical protein